MSNKQTTTAADINARITGVVGAAILTLAMAFGVTMITQNSSLFGSAPDAQVLGAQDSLEPAQTQEDSLEGADVNPDAPEAVVPGIVATPEPQPEPAPERTPEPEPVVTQTNNPAPVNRPAPAPRAEPAPQPEPTPEPAPQPEPTPEPEAGENVGAGEPEAGETPEDEPAPEPEEPNVEDPDGSGGWTPARYCAEIGEELGMMLIWNGRVCVDTSGQAIRRPMDPIVPIRPVDPNSLT